MKKFDKRKISYYILMGYMFLFPILDVVNSFIQRKFTISVSIGVIFKGFFLVYLFYFFLFKAKDKKLKKIFIVYLAMLFIWGGLFILNRYSFLSISNIISELLSVFKIFYFPIVTFLLYLYTKENNIKVKEIEKIFGVLFVEYLILLLIPYITNTGFSSYFYNEKGGFTGWFYAANELGPITIILIFEFLNIAVNNRLRNLWLILIYCFLMLLIGTKVAFLGLFIVLLYYLVRWLIDRNWKNVIFILVIICFSILATFKGVIIGNINKMLTDEKNLITNNNNKRPHRKPTQNNQNSEIPQGFLNLILSGRQIYFLNTQEIFENSRIASKLVGIGFLNTGEVNNINIEKSIEIDLLDIFFHCGIIGFVLYLLPYIFTVINIIKRLINLRKINWDIVSGTFIFALLVMISLVAGHILTAPAVSLLLALIIVMILLKLLEMEKEKKAK